MQWLLSWDVELFRRINQGLANPFFDVAMPFLSGNPFFIPALTVLGIWLLWKGGARGWLCVGMIALAVAVSDGLVSRNIKRLVGRERPFVTVAETRRPGAAKPDQMVNAAPESPAAPLRSPNSMPSSHAANWFAATMVALIYYRRSAWFMFPSAFLVGFSRIYNGVHYPSDVLAGAILGAGSGAAVVFGLTWLWAAIGQRWFPLWWARLPSLAAPPPPKSADAEFEEEPSFRPRGAADTGPAPQASLDTHWLRLGYIVLLVMLVARWGYIASGTILLSEDEAYQWLWSKHLALSYYSKPPLIAYTQFLGTHIWGDREFGVRFFSPVISTVMGFLVLRFFAREVNARAGFFLLLIVTSTPLLAVGSILMTVDPLSVLFWTAAMITGWKAVQENSTTRDWAWTGLWMGLGFLSKYTGLFQWLCWAIFFGLWPPARKQLRRPGPYVALLINLACALPVFAWNAQHHWITITHVSENAGVGQRWHPAPFDFLGSQLGVLNPFFLVAAIWASLALWRRGRHNPRLLYFFSMGAPVFLAYFAQSFRTRVKPNWIAPSVLPLFCLMVTYWDTRLRLGATAIRRWLAAGLVFGFVMVVLFHYTELWSKTFHVRRPIARLLHLPGDNGFQQLLSEPYLPVNLDPLHRVRGWKDVALVVNAAREELMAEGKPVFIITDHYGMAGELSFYLPEAKTNVCRQPLVYYRTSPVPRNQFYFWPGYENRKGQNAIFFIEMDRKDRRLVRAPSFLTNQFESVTDLGERDALYYGRVLRPLQVFACRGLK
jgi:4-amino-4-deoxy-L-arabinose transferase-like glycosyltransferase/membrane-associated phospholipid phosphatase